jgi:hypothetical protein
MERGKAISLNNLARSHSEEIDQMLSGITGSASSTLWTASMRPATRGGKCGFLRPEDEALVTDRAA